MKSKNLILALLFSLLITNMAYAQTMFRPCDKEGDCLDINSDGSVPITGVDGGVVEFDSLTINGDLTINSPGERLGGSNIDRWIDFNDNTFATTIGGGLYLRYSNIWFLEENENIDAFIASEKVASGDVIYLASGTYAVTADIDFDKAVSLIGAGEGRTVISTATSALNILDINIDGVTIKNLSITNTGAGTTNAIDATCSVATQCTSIFVENVTISMSSTGGQRCINLVDAAGVFKNITCSTTSSDSAAVGFRANPASTQEAVSTTNIYNSRFITSAGGSTDYGLQMTESTATFASTFNVYNTVGIATESAAATSAGLHATAATGAEIVVNVYGGYFAGTDDDLIQVSTATLNVFNTTLADAADTTGTITLLGTSTALNLAIGGTFISSATGSMGWSVVDQTDNQACTTGCTSACVIGLENATGAAITGIVDCAATTSDLCVCAGGS